jgi:hypothetical protein
MREEIGVPASAMTHYVIALIRQCPARRANTEGRLHPCEKSAPQFFASIIASCRTKLVRARPSHACGALPSGRANHAGPAGPARGGLPGLWQLQDAPTPLPPEGRRTVVNVARLRVSRQVAAKAHVPLLRRNPATTPIRRPRPLTHTYHQR